MSNTFFLNLSKKKDNINKKILLLEMYKKLQNVYPLKQVYNNIIPLNIYQTWHTKNLPPKMLNNVNKIKLNNPAFKYHLYDDNDCRKFIQENYPDDVLNAFDNLIPGAYKADLWRYCILYKYGGIYLDIKYKSHNRFKLINLTEKEHLVLDIDNECIYNALMVCLPNNQELLTAIKYIVHNVKHKFYGNSALDPTGPGLLKKIIKSNIVDMKHNYYNSYDNRYIEYNNYIIFKTYDGYLDECEKFKKTEHYANLWIQRKIYK
jgi:mannosyltransferase OCH1-like enzyme